MIADQVHAAPEGFTPEFAVFLFLAFGVYFGGVGIAIAVRRRRRK